ncbi:hypothetical protein AWH56_26855 [Anaerobacillus isosaccharinicus]|uniref:Uncharacterized protein n=1 Tax=Anaerobacillus isosaccharinicus TaxID=1532552 RepID=A0AC62A4M2_9BACI|nr:hypothetical protein [Anaerobacillus isosaccharinicus]
MPHIELNKKIIQKLEAELKKDYSQSLINAIKERISFRKSLLNNQ